LDNSGETVTLLDAFGTVLQSFAYGDSNVPGWPTTPDGDGPSLEYVGPLDGQEDPLGVSDPFEDPANWRASLLSGGSPGASGNPTPLAGDYDGNGTVEQLDYAKWKADFGMVVTPGNGADGNGDGVVDAADYSVWRDNLGNSIAAAATESGSVTIATVAEASIVNVTVPINTTEQIEDVPPPSGARQPTVQSTRVAESLTNARATTIDASLLLWNRAESLAADHVDTLELDAADSELDQSAIWEDGDWLVRLALGV
jgi:hypothetical protein